MYNYVSNLSSGVEFSPGNSAFPVQTAVLYVYFLFTVNLEIIMMAKYNHSLPYSN